ncbi:hypothetical protein E2C01_008943 [Portunus trituberculatus]|uniref:Uncharacterized protein n=1 Tax=Portunus trituberculatus TaxID=210409 RepID=A0A5B7D519_PORTR|nr:hypothetical protein [Portunus trituberculatus]
MTGSTHTSGFYGCIQKLSIGGNVIDNFLSHPLTGVNVIPCPRYSKGRRREAQGLTHTVPIPSNSQFSYFPSFLSPFHLSSSRSSYITLKPSDYHSHFPQSSLTSLPPLLPVSENVYHSTAQLSSSSSLTKKTNVEGAERGHGGAKKSIIWTTHSSNVSTSLPTCLKNGSTVLYRPLPLPLAPPPPPITTTPLHSHPVLAVFAEG